MVSVQAETCPSMRNRPPILEYRYNCAYEVKMLRYITRQVKHCTEYNVASSMQRPRVVRDQARRRKTEAASERLAQHSVIRALRNHPYGNRLPDAVARLALIRDEIGVIAVLNFVPIGFDMSCH